MENKKDQLDVDGLGRNVELEVMEKAAREAEERAELNHKRFEEFDSELNKEGCVGVIVNLQSKPSMWDKVYGLVSATSRHWIAIANLDKDAVAGGGALRGRLVLDPKCERPYWVEKAALLPRSEVL